MCKDNFGTEYKRKWPTFYKKNTMSVQSYGKAVPRAQKVNFSISHYNMCVYSSQRSGEFITTDFINGSITKNDRFLSAPNKTPDLSNGKSLS
jgi:hypothetical protein